MVVVTIAVVVIVAREVFEKSDPQEFLWNL